MQSTTKRHTKARKRLSLVFLYVPFLLMQLSYKFFIVANLYFYVHHQSQVMLQVDMSHELQNANKKGAHEKAGYYVTHLSIDKRYSHRVFSDNNFYDDPIITVPKPAFVFIERYHPAVDAGFVSSCCSLSRTSRGPPCA